MSENKTKVSRRDFLKTVGLTGVGLGAGAAGVKFDLSPMAAKAATLVAPAKTQTAVTIMPKKATLVPLASTKDKPPKGHRPTNEERLQAANNAKVARAQAKANGIAAAAVAPVAGGVPDYFGVWGNFAYSPEPFIDATGNVIAGTGMRKFVDGLPGLGPTNANNLGQYIPVANPDTLTYPGSDYYEIAAVQYTEKMHSDLPPTTLRGYVQINSGTNTAVPPANTVTPAPVHYLGPAIVATEGRPVRIKFVNMLPPTASAMHLYLPMDMTSMGAGMGYTDNRAVVHLHGGRTPWISDGTPHQWVAPSLEPTVNTKGASTVDVPDMVVPPGGQTTLYYSNQQSARLLFYHDHVHGITRLNVYMGMAAPYIITNPTENTLVTGGTIGTTVVAANTIPATQIPLVIQDKTFVPDTTTSYTNANGTFASQLAAQDPTWDTVHWGGKGNLWYPHVYMPNQNPFGLAGVTPMGRWDYGPWFGIVGILNGPVANPYYVAGGTEPPQIPGVPNISVVGETYHDTPIVNGTAYPTLTVQPQAYRFRILSVGNDRFFNFSFFQAAPLVISVTASGSGYTSVPAVNINGGSFTTPPTAAATMGVTGFTVTAVGAGYSATTPPTVTITGGGGAGATAAAVISPAGTITSIMMMTAGVGYTSVPTVTISAPTLAGGTQATATASLGVVQVNIVNRGTAAATGVAVVNPTITFSGGGGTGAAAIGSVLTDVSMVPAVPNPAIPFPTDWIVPTDGANVVTSDILDGRLGGVPDPRYVGPSWIQIGNESGFLPNVAVIPPMPIGYQHNNKNATWNNITKKSLYLGCAERADVIVDFSAYAGQTLILYSDSPAPVPMFDVRNDNFTNCPDFTPAGGAKSTLAGYGPNTRTIMQVRVANATPAAAVNITTLNTAIQAAYKATQDPPLVPQSAYNAAMGTAYPDDYVTIRDTEFSPAAAGTGVASVIVTNPGMGYVTTLPTVALTGGGGSGATATVNIAPLKSVTNFVVGYAGSGYTTAPTVTITGGGGTGATAKATVTAGVVTAVNVVTAGSNYSTPPTVTIAAPPAGGTTAQVAADIGTAFTVTAPGSGYTAIPTVTLTGGGGSGATATAYLGISTVTMVTVGSYPSYTTPPTITVTGGGGTGAVLVPVMAVNPIPGTVGGGNTVASVTVVSPGGGYTTPPTLTFSGGGAGAVQATATCVLGVGGINVVSAGTGYTTPPTVTITGGGLGTGATAIAINNTLTSGIIGTVTVTAPGTGYTTAPQVTFTGGMGATSAAAYATLQNTLGFHLQPKDVVPAFERYYGRLSMQFGANLTPFYYVDPPTEIWGNSVNPGTPVAGDSTQIWEINPGLGVDSHPLHFHLFDLQVINRIGADGVVRPPDANEVGWKEVIRINPFELLVVAARPYSPKLPFGLPNSVRLLSPEDPVGATGMFTNLTPGGGVTNITNQSYNFGYEYVWHCHILTHEENDMMRPVTFLVTTTIPAAPTGLAVNTAAGNVLTWTDTTPAATSAGNAANEVGFNVYRATGTLGAFALQAVVPANKATYTDGSAVAGTIYRYYVNAFNNAGTSAASNIVQVTTVTNIALPAAPALTLPAAGASLNVANPITFTWAAVTGATSYRLQVLSGTTVVVDLAGLIEPTITVPDKQLALGTYTWKVSTTNAKGTSAFSAANTFTVANVSIAPVLVSPASGSVVNAAAPVVLTWGAVTGATSYAVQVTASGSPTPLINVTGVLTASYTIAANTLAVGTVYSWQVNATTGVGTSPFSAAFTFTASRKTAADFDGDRKTDVSVYDPASGTWVILNSSTNTQTSTVFGFAGAKLVWGDYDGDGKTDLAVYDPATGNWFISPSGGGAMITANFGFTGAVPVPGDYDGDGKNDKAVYDPATGNWFISPSGGGAMITKNFGFTGAVPVPGDYDGDGKTDYAVYDPSGHGWFIWQSSTNTMVTLNFGFAGAVCVPADYDGDGKTDIAVYDPGSGNWFIQQSSTNTMVTKNYGFAGVTPVPGDYDGDGKTDTAVYEPATYNWYIMQSGTNTQVIKNLGFAGAVPVP